MQRFNNSRLSCFSRSSRHCTAEFEDWKTEANSIPEGPERTKAMEEIADFSYEKAIFLPFFEVVYVYGLSGDMEWQPYYGPRLRGNTMRFTEWSKPQPGCSRTSGWLDQKKGAGLKPAPSFFPTTFGLPLKLPQISLHLCRGKVRMGVTSNSISPPPRAANFTGDFEIFPKGPTFLD